MTDELLTSDEVASLLRVRPGTVRDWAWRRKIPVIRLSMGKRKAVLRFERSAIEQLIRERTVPAK